MAERLDGEVAPGDPVTPVLAGVPETMLWSLHNRASEARRADAILVDPGSLRIHAAIKYDFAGSFGDPHGSLAARAVAIDQALRTWLARHPDGTIISLGEGLETQARRVDNGRMRWISVDLPMAIRLRERFIAPTDRFLHLAISALDPGWMEAVDPAAAVFVVAQGLLMYLPPERVQQLLIDIADRFTNAELIFDTIPRWFSMLTRLGVNQTPGYRLPSMPWGIDRDELAPTLRHWHPRMAGVALLPYRSPRGLRHIVAGLTDHVPVARNGVPCLVHVTLADPIAQPASTLAAPGTILTRPARDAPALPPRHLRKPDMTDQNNATVTGATSGFLAAAAVNARCGGEIAVATSEVIAKRVALGMAATLNPMQADIAEFSRMVPEKLEAFSAAGMVMLAQSGQANRHMLRSASEEVMATAQATLQLTGCTTPTALAEAHGSMVRAWFTRAMMHWIALGVRTCEAQSAAMAPIRQTVVANAERLRG